MNGQRAKCRLMTPCGGQIRAETGRIDVLLYGCNCFEIRDYKTSKDSTTHDDSAIQAQMYAMGRPEPRRKRSPSAESGLRPPAAPGWLRVHQNRAKTWIHPGLRRRRGNARPVSAGPVDVHIVELGLVPGLDLNLLGRLATGVDPVTIQDSEDGFEAALLGLEATPEPRSYLYGSENPGGACRKREDSRRWLR